MEKLTKTITTVIITIVFILLLSTIGNSGAQSGSILGYLSVALIIGYIGAIVAIWKKKNDKTK